MEDSPIRFASRSVVITGAGSGIGRAIALRLAREGAKTVLLDFNREAVEETARMLLAEGRPARVLVTDVASTESIRAAFATISQVDVLINSAGIAHIGNVMQTSPDDLDRIYRVNIKGIYHCLYEAIPKMVAQGAGVILNLASIGAKIGLQDRFAYSMSKGAVLTMTLSVARDYVDKGIRCNCICPARIHTPFVDGFLEKNYPDRKEAMFRELSAYQPIGRMGRPEEVAAFTAFLCSDEAAFATGSAYDLDGGVTLLR